MSKESKQDEKTQKIRVIDVVVAALVVVGISVVLVSLVLPFFSEEYVPSDELSSLLEIEVGEITIPTIAAVTEPRVVSEVNWQTESEVTFTLPSREEAGNVTSGDLLQYADYLIDNKLFWPLDRNEVTGTFSLAKVINEDTILSIHARRIANNILIEYKAAEDIDRHETIERIEEIEELLNELSLDIHYFLHEAGGYNDRFASLYSSAALDRLTEMRDEGEDVDELSSRLLLLTVFGN